MKDMKPSERVGLLSTLIGAVITLAVGTGLSVLLDGFVLGFLVLAGVAAALFLIIIFRDLPGIGLQVREFRGKIEASRPRKAEMARQPLPPVGFEERVPLAQQRDDAREYRE